MAFFSFNATSSTKLFQRNRMFYNNYQTIDRVPDFLQKMNTISRFMFNFPHYIIQFDWARNCSVQLIGGVGVISSAIRVASEFSNNHSYIVQSILS